MFDTQRGVLDTHREVLDTRREVLDTRLSEANSFPCKAL
jgi:hypothetical protein